MSNVVVALFLVVVVLAFVYLTSGQNYINYVPDQIGTQSPDPQYYKWFGRQKDKWGNDPKEYFLENQMMQTNFIMSPELPTLDKFRDNFSLDAMRQYYPSSLLAIKEIKSTERPQHSYYTVANAPPAVAERALLSNAVADSNDMDWWPYS
jgi:hypothetical protein